MLEAANPSQDVRNPVLPTIKTILLLVTIEGLKNPMLKLKVC